MAHSTADRAVDRAFGKVLRPGVPEAVGALVGLAILAKGLSWQARRARLDRIEAKIDRLDPDSDP
jgi:hypothetical protein